MFKKTSVPISILVLLLTLVSCSEIPENNDPVLGVWAMIESIQTPEGKSSVREEWIFNDAYLGRYHKYRGTTLEIETDFSWQVERSVYTIEYPGLDRAPDQVRILNETTGPESLISQEGIPLAHRE